MSKIGNTLSMASTPPGGRQIPSESDEHVHTLQPGSDEVGFEQASNPPERPESHTIHNGQNNLNGDAEPEAGDPSDETRLTGSTRRSEEETEEDDHDEEIIHFNGAEEDAWPSEQGRGWTELGQSDANVLPDQLEIQFAHLLDVLGKMPDAIADDRYKIRQYLLKSGVMEYLIDQQGGCLAQSSAPKPSWTEDRAGPNSPPATHPVNLPAGTPVSPLLPTNNETDRQDQHIRNSDRRNDLPAEHNHWEEYLRTSRDPQRLGTSYFSLPILVAISGLEVRDSDNNMLYSLPQGQLFQAHIDLGTKILRVDVKGDSDAAGEGPED
jgi:hypothetical protein